MEEKSGKEAEPAVLRVGAPMWSHPAWMGRFFPGGTTDTLAAYASWCNAVEGNTTFYATPSATTIASWAGQAPDDFRFCFKVPRSITHDRRLRHVDDQLDAFLTVMAPLADRCGPVQIQLPPTFGPDDLGPLTSFVQRLPALDWTWAVEVRHPAFFPGGDSERRLNDMLAHHRVNRVLLDSRPLFSGPAQTPEEVEAFQAKPRVRVRPVATASQPIVRFIGLTDPNATRDHWQQWLPKVVEWLQLGLRPFVFIHTPDNVESPPLNRRFHEDVGRHLADATAGVTESSGRLELAPLPDPIETDEQLGLFDRTR